MKRRIWRCGIMALAACFGMAVGSASADDIQRLDLKKSSDAANSANGVGQFSHAARAQADDDDLEDVTLRYWLGLWRGQRVNNGYGVPPTVLRWPLFRAGYASATGSYGGGSGYRGFPSATPYASTQFYSAPSYAAAPVFYGPYNERVVISSTYPSGWPAQPYIAYRYEVPVAPRAGAFASQTFPYDGPATPQPAPRSYVYDGGPTALVPMPVEDSPAGVSPKKNSSDERIVKFGGSKKIAFPAYGDNRHTSSDDMLSVKQTK